MSVRRGVLPVFAADFLDAPWRDRAARSVERLDPPSVLSMFARRWYEARSKGHRDA